jgi:mRNA interferase MazF
VLDLDRLSSFQHLGKDTVEVLAQSRCLDRHIWSILCSWETLSENRISSTKSALSQTKKSRKSKTSLISSSAATMTAVSCRPQLSSPKTPSARCGTTLTTPSMTAYRFGDVVLVPFPFTDQTGTKKRPAVVVSSAAYHRERSDIILMAVTSQTRVVMGIGEIPILGWKESGLLKPSILKPVLWTRERLGVIRRLGQFGETDKNALRQSLNKILDIAV